ncbi:hypothetical protein AGR6A_Cc80416 [Agrobacterium sp. NCPPB 925]|nr:hypothetical protein AGR6A_Cc80416 [Agrobacterium sp. NCPPB 925]
MQQPASERTGNARLYDFLRCKNKSSNICHSVALSLILAREPVAPARGLPSANRMKHHRYACTPFATFFPGDTKC